MAVREGRTVLFADLELPADLEIDSAEQNPLCETNSVYFCRGRSGRSPFEGYLKIADRAARSLANEESVLNRIALTDISVPAVIASGGGSRPFLLVTAVPGTMLARRYDWPLLAGLLAPVGLQVVLLAGCNSVLTTIVRGGVRWRDDFHRLADLRRGMVQ